LKEIDGSESLRHETEAPQQKQQAERSISDNDGEAAGTGSRASEEIWSVMASRLLERA
jgi:hypothetical protein